MRLIDGQYLRTPFYGYPRMTLWLNEQGFDVNAKRVARLMRVMGLQATMPGPHTSRPHPEHRIYPYLLRGMEICGPNEVWSADITYIPTREGWLYLAVVLDAYSRKVVGYAVSERLTAQLALEALQMAVATRKPPAGCIHHSDQGVQYACDAYVAALSAAGLKGSMSRKGNPYDNARAESFMKTLKYEEVYLWEYDTLEEAAGRLEHFIEAVYNRKRLHSALGYVPPEEFEAKAGLGIPPQTLTRQSGTQIDLSASI